MPVQQPVGPSRQAFRSGVIVTARSGHLPLGVHTARPALCPAAVSSGRTLPAACYGLVTDSLHSSSAESRHESRHVKGSLPGGFCGDHGATGGRGGGRLFIHAAGRANLFALAAPKAGIGVHQEALSDQVGKGLAPGPEEPADLRSQRRERSVRFQITSDIQGSTALSPRSDPRGGRMQRPLGAADHAGGVRPSGPCGGDSGRGAAPSMLSTSNRAAGCT